MVDTHTGPQKQAIVPQTPRPSARSRIAVGALCSPAFSDSLSTTPSLSSKARNLIPFFERLHVLEPGADHGL